MGSGLRRFGNACPGLLGGATPPGRRGSNEVKCVRCETPEDGSGRASAVCDKESENSRLACSVGERRMRLAPPPAGLAWVRRTGEADSSRRRGEATRKTCFGVGSRGEGVAGV